MSWRRKDNLSESFVPQVGSVGNTLCFSPCVFVVSVCACCDCSSENSFFLKKNKNDERADLPNLFYELFTQTRPHLNRTRRE